MPPPSFCLPPTAAASPPLSNAVARIDVARGLTPDTSTQEDAWLLLAARALVSQAAGIEIDIAGDVRHGPVYRNFRPDDLTNGVKLTNSSDAALQAVLSVSGAPITPEPAIEKGFKIERLYFHA